VIKNIVMNRNFNGDKQFKVSMNFRAQQEMKDKVFIIPHFASIWSVHAWNGGTNSFNIKCSRNLSPIVGRGSILGDKYFMLKFE